MIKIDKGIPYEPRMGAEKYPFQQMEVGDSCISGRLMRHDPQDDDLDLMTDRGECPDCSGDGCGDEPSEAVSKAGRSGMWLERVGP